MAKRRFSVARAIAPVGGMRASAPIIVAPSAAPARTRRFSAALAKVKERGRAAALRARRVAYEERHQLSAVAAGAMIGLARRFAANTFEKARIGPLSPEATLGIAGFVAQRFGIRNEYLRHATTALLSIAAYQYASGAVSIAGDDSVPLPPPPAVGEDEIVEGEV